MKEKLHNFKEVFKELWTYYRGWKWLVFIVLLIGLITCSWLVILAKTTSVDTLQEALKSETIVYDASDQEAGTLSSKKGTYVPLDQISLNMQETVVATEDKRFYEHSGFDTIGMGRAFVRLLINRDTSGGGGSTITQQLAKNAFLSLDQTLERKLKELFLALEIEKEYSKDEILEMYLNHAYFGNGVWGVQDASQKYFGLDASQLDWNQSMVLTGMLKGPNLYNPIDDYDASIERRNVVCDVVLSQGVIDQETADWVKISPIEVWDNYYKYDSYNYPHYFDSVIEEAIKLTNIPEEDLQTKGYKIYTQLNQNYQTVLENSYEDCLHMYPDDGTGEPLVQGASVVVDPKTGGVSAIYGGRGDYVYRGFNRVIDMYRSPGSSIKPMAVYVPALENGYNINSTVPDVVKTYGSDNWRPENYNHYTEPNGTTSLWYALVQSKNTTAVHLMDEIGLDKSVQKLKQFGIEIDDKDKSLTLALGAMQKGVTPLQVASAYSAFANDGVRIEPTIIRRIEDASGKVVYKNEKPAKNMVMTKNVSYDMTSMMLDTYGGYGTGYGAGSDYGQLAGKTGSTEEVDGSIQTRDRWMVGYTPDFVLVSWMGLDRMGEESLDEIMPSGLGTLFNIQSTNLIANSPQTPFQVTPASSMTQSTNDVELDSWQDQAGEFIDEGLDWLIEKSSQVWQTIKEYTSGLVDYIGDYLR